MINNNELIDQIKSYNRFLNSESLNKAYNFALEAHQTQKRDEGVPYIIHPVAVAKILTDLKLDSATITTGLLHDTIEDTTSSKDEITKQFTPEIADLVERRWNKNFYNEIMYVVGDEWHAGNLSYHLSSRPIWYKDLKGKIDSLNPNGGIIYTGNSSVLKQLCPGDFGQINTQGFCMIGIKR